MPDTDFTEIAERTLERIHEGLEEADSGYSLDMDVSDSILSVELPSGDNYVINIHHASEQIWVSSPVSGGSHFSYSSDDLEWSDADGMELFALLTQEFYELAELEVRF